jgi:hypothetical protein
MDLVDTVDLVDGCAEVIRIRQGFRLRRASADKTADRWVAKFDHPAITPSLQYSDGFFRELFFGVIKITRLGTIRLDWG